MESKILIIALNIVIAILVIALAFFVMCVVISAIRYICEEINHTIKNAKRSTREFMWDLEWKWNHR